LLSSSVVIAFQRRRMNFELSPVFKEVAS